MHDYVHQEFPKFMYHPTERARIVADPGEQEALGEGWTETPSAEPKPETKTKKK